MAIGGYKIYGETSSETHDPIRPVSFMGFT